MRLRVDDVFVVVIVEELDEPAVTVKADGAEAMEKSAVVPPEV